MRLWLSVFLFFFLLLLLLFFGRLRLGFFFGFGGRFGDLTHDYNEVGFFDGKFFDGVLIVDSFALEHDFQ